MTSHMLSLHDSDCLDLIALVAPLPRGSASFQAMSVAFAQTVIAQVATGEHSAGTRAAPLNELLYRRAEYLQRCGGWWPEFGVALERAARNERFSAAVQLAIMFQANGVGGTWQVDLPEPQWFLAGAELIRVQGSVTAGVEGSRCFLRFRQGSRLTERWFAERISGDERDRAGEAPCSRTLPLLDPRGVTQSEWPLQDIPLRPVIDPSPVAGTTAAALELLERFAPEYASWVRRCIKVLMPVSVGENLAYSGSALERPGLVVVSFPTRPELLAEALVHEASHQHLYLGARFVSYCQQTSEAMYYSPIRQTERPLWAVLTAYHAVGNIVLYYARLLGNNVDPDGMCSRRFEYWTGMASEYDSGFERTEMPLTAAGRGIWMDLQAKVAAARAELSFMSPDSGATLARGSG